LNNQLDTRIFEIIAHAGGRINESDLIRSINEPRSTVKLHLQSLENDGLLYSRKGSYVRTFFLPYAFAKSPIETKIVNEAIKNSSKEEPKVGAESRGNVTIGGVQVHVNIS
jgi:predicted transcriptional regulator